jgi:hypothetical protein
LMDGPEPEIAPVMPPVIVPTAHVKLPGTLDVNAIPGLAPLQVLAVVAFRTDGAGLTVIVIVNGVPGHEPVVEIGVTIYATVPGNVLLGLISI